MSGKMTDHERAKKLREREIRALQACTCRYPLVQYRYRNGHGHEPKCPAGEIGKVR